VIAHPSPEAFDGGTATRQFPQLLTHCSAWRPARPPSGLEKAAPSVDRGLHEQLQGFAPRSDLLRGSTFPQAQLEQSKQSVETAPHFIGKAPNPATDRAHQHRRRRRSLQLA